MSDQKLLDKEKEYDDLKVNGAQEKTTKGNEMQYFPIKTEEIQIFFDIEERRNQNLDLREFQKRYVDVKTFAYEKIKVNIKQGLSDKNETDLKNRKIQFGQNEKIQIEPKQFCNLIVEQLSEPFIIILLAAAIVNAMIESLNNSEDAWMDAFGILCAVCIVGFVGAFTEYAKDKQLRKLHEANEERVVTVIRDSIEKQINTEQLLVGDIVYLKPGDKIPADGLLISGLSMKVNELSLTGETKQIPKKEDSDPFLISNTNLSSGCGTYLVCVVGLNSFAGKTKLQLQNIKIEKTALSQNLQRAAKSIAILGLILAVLFFIILSFQYIFNYHLNIDSDKQTQREKKQLIQFLVNGVLVGICLIVVVVPEG